MGNGGRPQNVICAPVFRCRSFHEVRPKTDGGCTAGKRRRRRRGGNVRWRKGSSHGGRDRRTHDDRRQGVKNLPHDRDRGSGCHRRLRTHMLNHRIICYMCVCIRI